MYVRAYMCEYVCEIKVVNGSAVEAALYQQFAVKLWGQVQTAPKKVKNQTQKRTTTHRPTPLVMATPRHPAFAALRGGMPGAVDTKPVLGLIDGGVLGGCGSDECIVGRQGGEPVLTAHLLVRTQVRTMRRLPPIP